MEVEVEVEAEEEVIVEEVEVRAAALNQLAHQGKVAALSEALMLSLVKEVLSLILDLSQTQGVPTNNQRGLQ